MISLVHKDDSSRHYLLASWSLVNSKYEKGNGHRGVFFKVKDPAALKAWYDQHLGFNTDQWGQMFKFRKLEAPEKFGYLQWSPFKDDTDYFQPSEKQWMINYRVENIESLVEQLRTRV